MGVNFSITSKSVFRENVLLLFLGISCFLIGITTMHIYAKLIRMGYHYTSVLTILLSIFGILIIMLILVKIIRINSKELWYEKNNSILEKERSLVTFNYPNFKLDIKEQDDRLFWHGEIISNSGTPYHIQIVYDNDFKGQFNKIHTCFIESDLLELQNLSNKKTPFLFKDSSNQFQLQFKTKTKTNKNLVLYYIGQSKKWINNFESWSKKDITLEEFKNLKID